MAMRLEDLPNEIFLFTFNYLSTIDILCTFYRLNRRLSSLIRTIPHLHLNCSSYSLSKTQFIHVLNQARSLNIESITLSTRYYVDIIPFFISYIPPSQLNHLRSLTLIDVDRTAMEKLLHNHLHLTSLTIQTSSWRSIPRHCLPFYPNLTHCYLPSLDLLHHCHTQLTHLTLTHCTAENLSQLITLVPNLQSLTLTLTHNIHVPSTLQFPMQLTSLKLTLRSVLFTEFERLIMMTNDQLNNLTVSFSNTEHDVHCFDSYLFGDNWFNIAHHLHRLQLNIIIHRTFDSFAISDLLSNFHWFHRRLICQSIDHTNGYHLFTLPFIDRTFTLHNQIDDRIEINDFNRVHHLHIVSPNELVQYPIERFFYQNLQTLTIIIPHLDHSIELIIDHLSRQSRLRTLEFRLTSIPNDYRDEFEQFISRLPLSIETLILNTISTRIFSEILDDNHQLLTQLKRLICSVKNRDQFDTLILLLLESFHEKSLVYLNISVDSSNKSSNLLSGWLLKTNYLKKARIKSSDRQCSIWI